MYIIVIIDNKTFDIALIPSRFFTSINQAEEQIEKYKISDKSTGWDNMYTYEIYEVTNIKDIIR